MIKTTLIALFICVNSGFLYSQDFKDVNFPEGSVAGLESKLTIDKEYRIYQVSQNLIKFDLPSVSIVNISLYDESNNLVRTYIYNNLKAGSYDINISSVNLGRGNFTCVLSSGSIKQSSKLIID